MESALQGGRETLDWEPQRMGNNDSYQLVGWFCWEQVLASNAPARCALVHKSHKADGGLLAKRHLFS